MDQRTDAEKSRSIDYRIERLRQRIIVAAARDPALRPILDILKGVLDLLGDEL